jgi:hypothetical protein
MRFGATVNLHLPPIYPMKHLSCLIDYLIQHFIQHVLMLKQISNELHFELVHTIAEGGMGMLHEAKQMGTGHSSQRAEIKLIRGSMPTAREVFIRAIGYRPTNVKLAT